MPEDRHSLKAWLRSVAERGGDASVHSGAAHFSAGRLLRSALLVDGSPCHSRRVALSLGSSLDFVRALIALDGVADRILLLDAAIAAEEARTLMAETGCDVLVTDRRSLDALGCSWKFADAVSGADCGGISSWLMTTSGTTGRPKVVPHSLATLTAALRTDRLHPKARWGLLYEASRFAGVQVVLHALLGGGKLLAIDLQKSFADQVAELAAGGCTHLSATAAMWRKLLMLPAAAGLSLQQITLGGDVADARTLQALAATFPEARIRHIYASTELGIGFSVNDGMPGFPADWLEQREAFPWLKICDGVLWARPSGPRGGGLRCDGEGYICTGDRVEVIGNRILFAGRVDSTTNVGGIKISMEAVEHAVRQHADVLDCRVTARPSPVMGSVLALEVMPRKVNADSVALQRELRSWCRDRLRREARPATISIIIDLPRNGAGKVERRL